METLFTVPMTSTASATRRFKVLGSTEDYAGCDCCGRMNLKVYVVLEEIETGEILHFGTGCAAKAENATVEIIRDEIKAARDAAATARRAVQADEDAAFFAWVADTYGVVATQAADLWNKVPGMTPYALRLAFR